MPSCCAIRSAIAAFGASESVAASICGHHACRFVVATQDARRPRPNMNAKSFAGMRVVGTADFDDTACYSSTTFMRPNLLSRHTQRRCELLKLAQLEPEQLMPPATARRVCTQVCCDKAALVCIRVNSRCGCIVRRRRRKRRRRYRRPLQHLSGMDGARRILHTHASSACKIILSVKLWLPGRPILLQRMGYEMRASGQVHVVSP